MKTYRLGMKVQVSEKEKQKGSHGVRLEGKQDIHTTQLRELG